MKTIANLLQKKWPAVYACYDAETLKRLEAAYAEPHRGYHATAHIVDLLGKLEKYDSAARNPNLIAHAILWHDAIYRTHDNGQHRADALNVEESAKLFESVKTSLTDEDRRAVSAMIRATSGHNLTLPQNHLEYNDTALFLDLDLSVLAQPYADFTRSTALIRKEYPHVSDTDFKLGRAKFLDSYVSKPALFFHPVTARVFDAPARANMKRQAQDLRQTAVKKKKEKGLAP